MDAVDYPLNDEGHRIVYGALALYRGLEADLGKSEIRPAPRPPMVIAFTLARILLGSPEDRADAEREAREWLALGQKIAPQPDRPQ